MKNCMHALILYMSQISLLEVKGIINLLGMYSLQFYFILIGWIDKDVCDTLCGCLNFLLVFIYALFYFELV